MHGQIDGKGTGWLPDYPDFRDYTPDHELVAPLLMGSGGALAAPAALLGSVDLRQWCSPVEDQGNLGSCTANAGVGLIEYFERRSFGKFLIASRLFLYKATRNLLHWQGDTGAFLRTTMGALVLFGVPPEEYWPYVISHFDQDPPAFCYAFAKNYEAINYYRLDPPGTGAATVVDRIRNYAASGLPSMFGFSVYSSISQAGTTGEIPLPVAGEHQVGGHAMVVVGYDDTKKVKNANATQPSTGAFLIRNSWGASWGDHGYGWLPYDYVRTGLATDWWSLISSRWVDTGRFGP